MSARSLVGLLMSTRSFNDSLMYRVPLGCIFGGNHSFCDRHSSAALASWRRGVLAPCGTRSGDLPVLLLLTQRLLAAAAPF